MGANAEVTLSVRLKDTASAELLKKLDGINSKAVETAGASAKAGSALETAMHKGGTSASAVLKKLTDVDKHLAGVAVNSVKTGAAMESAMHKGSAGAELVNKKVTETVSGLGKLHQSAQAAGVSLDALARKGALTGTGFGVMVQASAKTAQNLKQGDVELSRMHALALRTQAAVGLIGHGLSARIKAAGAGMKNLAGGGTALVGGVYMGAQTFKPQISYDRKLGQMANTGFSDEGVAGRLAGKEWLKNTIDKSVAQGGGLRNSAADALKIMVASGVFVDANGTLKKDELETIMPDVQKVISGVGGNPEDVANMVIAARQVGGLDANQIKALLGKGVVAGGSGQFDLPDMAKWMPQLYAQSGGMMKGMMGTESLFANLQAVRMTSGTSDAAGTNMQQFLKDITAVFTSQHAKKAFGIDVKQELLAGRAQGKDVIESFTGIAEKILANNQEFQDLRNRAANTKDDGERQRMYDEMAGIVQNTELSKLLHNTEAMKAMVAIMNNKDKVQKIKDRLHSENGQAVDTAYDTVKNDAQAGVEKMQNSKDIGVDAALQELTPNIHAAADAFARLVQSMPVASGAGVAVVNSGVGVLGGMALMRMMGGGATAGGTAAGLGLLGGAKLLARRAGWIGAGIGVIGDAMTLASDHSSAAERREAKYSLGGTAAGAVVGGVIGSLVPVLGTALGASFGSALGGYLGGKFADWTAPAQSVPLAQTSAVQAMPQIPSSQELVQANAQLQQINVQMAQLNQNANNDKLLAPLGQIQSGIATLNSKQWSFAATIPVYVDGHQVAQTVNTINGQQASRG